MLLGQYLYTTLLQYDWRYDDLLKWTLFIFWFSTSSIVISIMLKWLLIGKRKPGEAIGSTWSIVKNWAIDWHFQVSTGLLLSMTTHSRLWNIFLMMHGIDIDLESIVAAVGSLLPSKLDLISVKKYSFQSLPFRPRLTESIIR